MLVDNGYVVSWDGQPTFSCLFFPVFVPFSFSILFSSNVSVKSYYIDISYLVYRKTTTFYFGVEYRLCSICFFFLYLFKFLSLHAFNTVIFVKDCSDTVQCKAFIFDI